LLKEIPDPFGGLTTRVKRFYEHFAEKRSEGFTLKGAPFGNIGTPTGADRLFTIAVNITGGES